MCLCNLDKIGHVHDPCSPRKPTTSPLTPLVAPQNHTKTTTKKAELTTFMARPKYLLTLVVTDLSNIPKPSGHCYVQWRVASTLPTIRGRTPPAHIRDYRCVWKHSDEAVVKLSTNSNGMLMNKELEFEVYAVVRHHHQHHHRSSSSNYDAVPPHFKQASHVANAIADDLSPQRTEKTLLGRVSINIAEFCGEEATTPMRYLLKDSKVNAVLSVEIGMTLLKGDSTAIQVPPLRSRGLTSAFSDSINETSSHGTNGPPSIGFTREHRRTASGSQVTSSDQKLHRSLKMSSDPVVARLYQRTFEMSWDPRPGEFTSEESVDDMFHGGDGWAKNEQGESFVDIQLQKIQDSEKSALSYLGRLKETDVRHEMRSWNVTHLVH